jgi:hypothetical protein
MDTVVVPAPSVMRVIVHRPSLALSSFLATLLRASATELRRQSLKTWCAVVDIFMLICYPRQRQDAYRCGPLQLPHHPLLLFPRNITWAICGTEALVIARAETQSGSFRVIN